MALFLLTMAQMTSEAPVAPRADAKEHVVRVLLAVRDGFERLAICDALERDGFTAILAGGSHEAMTALEQRDPHVVIVDLDAPMGSTAGELLNRVHVERPWVGVVALTSHASPQLALPPGEIPPHTIFLVKSRLSSLVDISHAVQRAIALSQAPELHEMASAQIVLTRAQGEILRLIAEGYSNAGIARLRGTSVRAAESLVQRTLQAMGITADEDHNARVLAVRRWLAGDIVVR
jgi:DNA-binding NarL/FixJ family response regulator